MSNEIELYLDTLKMEILSLRQLSPKTAEAYVSDTKLFLAFLYENLGKKVENCTKKDFLQYVAETKKSYTTRSIARKIAALRFFYHTLSLHFSIENLTFENIAMPKISRKLPQYLSHGELLTLFRHLNLLFEKGSQIQRRDAFMIMILYVTGLRISELIALKKGDLKKGYIQVVGKGNRERMIPIPNEFMPTMSLYINSLRKGQQYLFLRVGTKGFDIDQELTRGYVYKRIVTIMRRIFPERNFSPHSLRHSIATHLLNKGMDLRSLQAFLGHQSIATVALYTHLDVKRLKSSYQNFHPRSEKIEELKPLQKKVTSNAKK